MFDNDIDFIAGIVSPKVKIGRLTLIEAPFE